MHIDEIVPVEDNNSPIKNQNKGTEIDKDIQEFSDDSDDQDPIKIQNKGAEIDKDIQEFSR